MNLNKFRNRLADLLALGWEQEDFTVYVTIGIVVWNEIRMVDKDYPSTGHFTHSELMEDRMLSSINPAYNDLCPYHIYQGV